MGGRRAHKRPRTRKILKLLGLFWIWPACLAKMTALQQDQGLLEFDSTLGYRSEGHPGTSEGVLHDSDADNEIEMW